MKRRKPDLKRYLWYASIVVVYLAAASGSARATDRAAWMQQARWGVMNHYLAGEINDPNAVDLRRAVAGKHDGVQVHVLSYLGQRWGMGAPRFSTEDVVRWSRERTRNGCALTWDVPVQANGLMSPPFIDQLTAVGQALGRP